MVAIRGHFDGKVFVPDEPVHQSLPRDCPLVLRVEVVAAQEDLAADAWAMLVQNAGSITAPADWSGEHDHYLYALPKRPDPGQAT